MTPEIEFHATPTSRAFYRVRSSGDIVRFRITVKRDRVTFDGDWYSTRWELAPAAWDLIERRWNAERSLRRKSRCSGDCCGGKACVIFTSPRDQEEAWREFLLALLSQSSSWLVLDRYARLVPASSIPPVVPAQSAHLSFRLENQNGN
jgi:hypothetical protein